MSPALFNIAAEVLSRTLNQLNNKANYIGFSMNRNVPQINHLCYADDLILSTSGDEKTVNMVMKVLKEYQDASRQKVNKNKINFYTHGSSNRRSIRRCKRLTGYKHGEFPFTYLGCPIFTGRKKVVYFTDLATKILNKAGGWQGKMLSLGGRAVIIKHILQSQSLHLLAALIPPKTVIKQIKMYFSNFF